MVECYSIFSSLPTLQSPPSSAELELELKSTQLDSTRLEADRPFVWAIKWNWFIAEPKLTADYRVCCSRAKAEVKLKPAGGHVARGALAARPASSSSGAARAEGERPWAGLTGGRFRLGRRSRGGCVKQYRLFGGRSRFEPDACFKNQYF